MPQTKRQYNPDTRRYEPIGDESAPAPAPSSKSLRGLLGLPEREKTPEEFSDLERVAAGLPPKEKESGWRDYVALGVRGLSGLVPGGPWGAAAGGVGEGLAQLIEGRDKINLAQIGTQAGLGFIPFGRALKGAGQAAVRGAAHGALGGGATHLAETGIPTDKEGFEDLAASTAIGAGIGGAAGGTVKKLGDLLKGARSAETSGGRYSAGVRTAQGEPRGTFETRPGQTSAKSVGVKPGEGTTGGRVPFRSNVDDIVPEEGIPQSAYVTDDFRPTKIRDRGPDAFAERELAGTLFEPPTAAPARPKLTADETAGVLKGRAKFSDQTGLDYGTGGMAPGFYDELDRAGVEYNRTQNELKRLLGLPDADPREVERMRQGARELGSRLRKGAKLPPISGGESVQAAADDALSPVSTARVPDEILPPEQVSLAHRVDPLNAIETVDDLPHAQVRPNASEFGDLAQMLGARLDEIPTSKRIAQPVTEVADAPVPQPKFASKIANDVMSGGNARTKAPDVSDETASSLRRLFSERGGAATVRPETSADLAGGNRLPPEFAHMLQDETGEAATDLQFALLSGILGGGLGYVASPDDHKGLGTAAGVATGLGAYGTYRRPDLWEQWTTAAMLSSPKTFAKIISGNIGGPLIRAGQKAFVDQDPEILGRTARELFSPDTVDAFTRKFQDSTDAAADVDRLGSGYATSGPTSWPGRIIGSLDAATKDAVGRAGWTPEEAARVTLTAEPENPLLRQMLSIQRENRAARIPFPFFKTQAGQFEQGLLEPFQAGKRVFSGEGSRQDIASLATALGVGGAGYLAAEQLPAWAEPFATAAMGPYAAPAAIGAAMTHVPERSSAAQKLVQLTRSVSQQLPLAEETDYDPRQVIARAVPNVARDVATLTDDQERQTNEGLFDQAISKIPFLREYLKPKKAKKRD